jgi:hypothetical protein
MSAHKSILIINAIINKNNMAELQFYLDKMGPVFQKHQGKPLWTVN